MPATAAGAPPCCCTCSGTSAQTCTAEAAAAAAGRPAQQANSSSASEASSQHVGWACAASITMHILVGFHNYLTKQGCCTSMRRPAAAAAALPNSRPTCTFAPLKMKMQLVNTTNSPAEGTKISSGSMPAAVGRRQPARAALRHLQLLACAAQAPQPVTCKLPPLSLHGWLSQVAVDHTQQQSMSQY